MVVFINKRVFMIVIILKIVTLVNKDAYGTLGKTSMSMAKLYLLSNSNMSFWVEKLLAIYDPH